MPLAAAANPRHASVGKAKPIQAELLVGSLPCLPTVPAGPVSH
jgi:hypothetical protein